MTVQNLYDLFARYKKNISDVSNPLFFDWADEINRFAYRIIYGTDPERFIVTSTFSVVANDASYSLPVNFLNMEPKGCGFFKVDGNGNPTNARLTKTGYGSQIEGYYINEGNVFFTPTPQQSTTYIQRYIPSINTIDDMADILVIPDEFIYYARNAIDCLYDMWDEDVPAEGLADQRFSRSLDELARNIRKDSAATSVNTQARYYRS